MARNSTALKKERILAVIRETGGNVSRACEQAQIPRKTAYNWKSEDPQFADMWEEAVEQGTEELEQEARRRAFSGVDEPVFYQGETCGTVRKYSDTLLIFLLKARNPAKYRERTEISGPNGQPLIPTLPEGVVEALTAGYKAIASGGSAPSG